MDALFFCMKITHTRHDGSLSIGHANSSEDMLNRLETLVLMGLEIPLADCGEGYCIQVKNVKKDEYQKY